MEGAEADMPRQFKRVRTLLYDDQRFRPGELDLLHTPALQRLYDLHQLGLTDRVYIDASHSRIHHVVGVMEQAQNLCDSLQENLEASVAFRPLKVRDETGQVLAFAFDQLVGLVKDSVPVIRLIALFHDLTHSPYGHTVEDEIELISCKHDEPPRQSEVFLRLVCQYIGWLAIESGHDVPGEIVGLLDPAAQGGPPTSAVVVEFTVGLLRQVTASKPPGWELPVKDILQLFAHMLRAMTALLHLELLHGESFDEKHVPKDDYPFQKILRGVVTELAPDLLDTGKFVPRRDAFMLDLIGNTVCADLFDYAQRDSHFANLKIAYDADRIAENFTLVTWDACQEPGPNARPENPRDPFGGDCIRTAISLYSHKLRIDVPSELMNLLNVRFYLYERVLFHPTKCAAGAMLGTALQLLGDNTSGSSGFLHDGLPKALQHIGDSVFLDYVYHAARLALTATRKAAPGIAPEGPGNEQGVLLDGWNDQALASLGPAGDSPHVLIAREIVTGWRGQSPTTAAESIDAGCQLLRRLTSRRFYRPIFRSLPNAHNEVVDKGPEHLAKKFLNPLTRYTAERAIEDAAKLKRGSIVIHCPRINTARKIANVLLFLPKDDTGTGEIRKLREIGGLDREVFGAHEKAINAVEDMYRSMWRLAVYVAPEYLDRWWKIADVAGSVVFKKFDPNDDHPRERWENDRHLVRELKKKYGFPEADESPSTVDFREARELVAIGAIEPAAVDLQMKKTLRPQAVLKLVLPALGKEKLDKKDEHPFAEFAEESLYPLESDEFVGWYGQFRAELAVETKGLETALGAHFKAGGIGAVIEKMKSSLKRYRGEKKSK